VGATIAALGLACTTALLNAERPDGLLHPALSFCFGVTLGDVFEDAISAPGLDVALVRRDGSPHKGRNDAADAECYGCCDGRVKVRARLEANRAKYAPWAIWSSHGPRPSALLTQGMLWTATSLGDRERAAPM
jgi:hypothetical protein